MPVAERHCEPREAIQRFARGHNWIASAQLRLAMTGLLPHHA